MQNIVLIIKKICKDKKFQKKEEKLKFISFKKRK